MSNDIEVFKKSRPLSSWRAIFLWIFLFRSTELQNSSILDKSFESFSYAGLTLVPRALSVIRYTEKSLIAFKTKLAGQ